MKIKKDGATEEIYLILALIESILTYAFSLYLFNEQISFSSMLLAFTEKFNTITDVLLEKLTKIADGKTSVSLYNEVNSATLDAIGLVRSIFKSDYYRII